MSLPEALATRVPEKIDRALLASLPSGVKAALTEQLGPSIDPVYGFDPVTAAWEIAPDAPVAPADLMEGLRLVGLALYPSARQVIADELVRLRLLTKSRTGEPAEYANATLKMYAEEIADYPEDAIVDACRRWGRRETFWPSLAELRAELDRVVNRRRLLREALHR